MCSEVPCVPLCAVNDVPYEVRHVASAVSGSLVYILASHPNPGRASAKYTASTDRWTSVRTIPTLRGGEVGGGAAVSIGGGNQIYVLGGWTPPGSALATSEEYTVATDVWATKSSMPTARKGLAATASTTSLFAVGSDGPGTSSSTLEMLTFATDVWTSRKRPLSPPPLNLAPGNEKRLRATLGQSAPCPSPF